MRIGISSCLLGEGVRFDGGHKRDVYLIETFGRFVEWVRVCPEVECGLGTPRESMRLIGALRWRPAPDRQDRIDHTDRMARYSERRVDELASEELCGYVLKKDSPSCGLHRVRVYGAHGVPTKSGRGIFAARLVDRFPSLPVEEEGRLSDPRLRENFIERVFAYSRLRNLFSSTWNARRARRLSYGAQADSHGAFARRVSAPRPTRRCRARRSGQGARDARTPNSSWPRSRRSPQLAGTRTSFSTWSAISRIVSTAIKAGAARRHAFARVALLVFRSSFFVFRFSLDSPATDHLAPLR